MKITGMSDRGLAERYLENAWGITEYLIDHHYPEPLFVGVGIPYNRHFMTLKEILEIGEKIAGINRDVQVCLLDYSPIFRRRGMQRPSKAEMSEAREILIEAGLYKA